MSIDPVSGVLKRSFSCQSFALTLLSAGSTALNNAVIGQHLTEELLQEVGATAARETQPIDDLRASAEYRRHLVAVLIQRALRNAFARAKHTKG